MKKMKEILFGLMILSIAIAMAYGGWVLKRSINYSMDYEDKVIKTIETKYEARISKLEKDIKILKQGK